MTPRLLTIPVSHYCEKARWALDRQGVAFTEEQHLPFFHMLPVRRAGGRRQVPILVTDEGVVGSSSDIVRYADRHRGARPPLFPAEGSARDEVERLVERFDDDLGPHTRRLAYSGVLRRRDVALRHLGPAVPGFERTVARLSFPLVALLLSRALRITPAGVERSRKRISEVFDDVDQRLADGRRYLVGDALTAADLTFAALAAPMLAPPENTVPLPQPEDLPEDFAAEMRALRARPAGRFALRLYAEERRA